MVGLTSVWKNAALTPLHVDIILAGFFPGYALGVTSVVRLASPKPGWKFDVHLMVNDNHFFVDEMLKANPHQMCFHLKPEPHPDMLLRISAATASGQGRSNPLPRSASWTISSNAAISS